MPNGHVTYDQLSPLEKAKMYRYFVANFSDFPKRNFDNVEAAVEMADFIDAGRHGPSTTILEVMAEIVRIPGSDNAMYYHRIGNTILDAKIADRIHAEKVAHPKAMTFERMESRLVGLELKKGDLDREIIGLKAELAKYGR